jgi:hypothetical protein
MGIHGPMPIKGRFGSTDKQRSSVDHPDPRQPRTGKAYYHLISPYTTLYMENYLVVQ